MESRRRSSSATPARITRSSTAPIPQANQVKAHWDLSEAMESHDVAALQKAIPQASSAGLPAKQIDIAQRLLDFELNRELFGDLLVVRQSVEALAHTLQTVESKVKEVSEGSLRIQGGLSVETWLTTIVEQVENQIWDALEKRVDEKVTEAIATATDEIRKSSEELGNLLGEANKTLGISTSSGMTAMGSSNSEDSNGKKTNKMAKNKNPLSMAAGNASLFPEDCPGRSPDFEGREQTNSIPERRTSVLAKRITNQNPRIAEALGLRSSISEVPRSDFENDEGAVQVKAVPAKQQLAAIGEEPLQIVLPKKPKRKPVEETHITSIFADKIKIEEIQNMLAGKGLDDHEEYKNVPELLKEPQNWGIRVKDVKEFFDYIQQDLFGYVAAEQSLGEDFSTNLHVVTPRFIKPWTKQFGSYGFAGVFNAMNLCLSKYNSLEEIMTARIFISHCWNENFHDFVTTMSRMLEPEDVVWVCALSICQNVDIKDILGERIEDSPFWRAMPHCRRVAMLIDRKAEPFERAWCALEEYLATYKLRLPFSICMPDTMDEEAWNEVDQKLKNFSIADCKASEESDKQKIMDIIGDKADIIDRVVRDESRKACFAARVMKVATHGTIEDLLPFAMNALAQVTDGSGRSILHMCAQMGRATALKDLLEHDLACDVVDQAGKTPLHFASEFGMSDVAKVLIKKRADVNFQDNQSWTPLSFASTKGQVAIVPLLVLAGANIESPDSDGFTPLLAAAVGGCAGVAVELIKLKASLQVRDAYGHSALTLASQAKKTEVVNVLIKAGVDTNESDADGCTPLMYASGFGYEDVVELLLRAKADTTVKDNQGYTAFDFATDDEHQFIITLLESAALGASGILP